MVKLRLTTTPKYDNKMTHARLKLLSVGKYEEAVKAMKYISEVNGTNLDDKRIEELLRPLNKEIHAELVDQNEGSFLTIIMYPRVLVRFLALCLIE